MMKSMLRAALPLVLLVLAACATTSPGSKGSSSAGLSAEEAISKRAVERWDALIKRDAAGAWTYLSPGYRSANPQAKYAEDMNNRPVRWSRVAVFVPPDGRSAFRCDEAKTACTVELEVNFKVRSHLTGVGVVESMSVVVEHWIKSGKEWYVVPQDVVK